MSIIQVLSLPIVELGNAIRWWYGPGLRWMNRWFIRELVWVEQREHLGRWMANLFSPMYGDASWQGRMISIFMRIIVLVYRLVWSLVWSVLHGIMWLCYAALPPLALLMIVKRFL
ncbi:hypothetical protein HZA86_04245 [Candidatus Uhrbacteria bacterium]|nr:hypothetical protein [Candidatus Uhrbacteria bacterium]